MLERLLKDEKELSDITVAMENEHKRLVSLVQKSKDEITELAKSITEIMQKLNEKKALLTAIKTDIITYSATMQKVNGEKCAI